MDLKQRTVFRGDDGELFKTVRPPRDSVKVWKDETDDGVEATFIKVPISSTSEDRDGDEFTEEGLERMVEQLQAGDVPMFLDHGISPETGWQDYRALEAVGGWKDGEIEDGVAYGIGALEPEHDDASTLESRLENGVVPIGWSVGFIPRETEPKTDDEGERVGEQFYDHDLLEVSSVGIPSNPDGVSASVAQAAKAFGRSRGVDVDAEKIADGITSTLEEAIDEQRDAALLIADRALEEYDELDRDVDDQLLDFVEWSADESDHDGETVEVIVSEYVTDVEASDEDDPGLRAWIDEQRDVETDADDGDGEGEEGDDEDDDGEEESADDDTGDTIDTDTVDAIASAVGDAVGRQLDQHREALLEELEPITNESDEDEEGDDEDDDSEEDGVDSSSVSFTGSPKGITTYSSGDVDEEEGKDSEEGEASGKETGEPAGPTFNPGTASN